MIDFKNPSYMKLKEIDANEAHSLVAMMLVDGESLLRPSKPCAITSYSPTSGSSQSTFRA